MFREVTQQVASTFGIDLRKVSHTLFAEVWAVVFKRYHQSFPNVCKVAAHVLVSPVSSVECERGFSVQNHIKSKLRNCLAVDTLDMLMRLRLFGPHRFAELDLQAAVQGWFDMRKYRHIASANKPRHWHLLAQGKNSKQANVYVMWDDTAASRVGPTYAGVDAGGEEPAVSAADDIAAAHAEQSAAAAAAGAQEEDFLSTLGGGFDEFSCFLGALGVLQDDEQQK